MSLRKLKDSKVVLQLEDFPHAVPAEYYDHSDSDQNCVLCHNPKYKIHIQSDRYGIPLTFQQCQCGLIKQTPLPNKEFFEWFFNSSLFYRSKSFPGSQIWGFFDYFKDESCRMATSKYRYRKLSPFFGEAKTLDILKIGPSTGTFLKVAKDHGHNVLGCDISSDFVGYARDTYGVQIDHGRFEKMNYQSQNFDAIFLFNVIENIPNQIEFFKEINRVLKPQGLFIFNFVNMAENIVSKFQKDRYFLFRPPVCYLFSAAALDQFPNQMKLKPIYRMRDFRYMNLEKVTTLLGLGWLSKLAELLKIHNFPFLTYAYPSQIVVCRKVN